MSLAESTRPDVSETGPSLRVRLVNLEVGQTVSLCRKFKLDGARKADLDHAAVQLNNHARPAVARAKQDGAADYTTETVHGFTVSRDPCVFVIITRTQ